MNKQNFSKMDFSQLSFIEKLIQKYKIKQFTFNDSSISQQVKIIFFLLKVYSFLISMN